MFPYEEIFKQQVKIATEGYLDEKDIEQCALSALRSIAEKSETPFHTIEKNAKQLVDSLRNSPEYLYDNSALDAALNELSAKLVKEYYRSYFTVRASEFQVMKDVHKVTQILPLGEEKETEICKEVLEEAKERHEERTNSFYEAFFTYLSPFLNNDGKDYPQDDAFDY